MSPFEMTPILTPSPPRAPLPQTFSFHSTEIFDFRVAAKKTAQKLHTTTTTYFFWQIQNKKLKNFCRI